MRELAKYKKTTNGHALILESLHSNIQKKNIALEGPYHKRIWDTRNSGRYAPLFLVWSVWAHLFITKTIVPSFITQTFDPPFVTKNFVPPFITKTFVPLFITKTFVSLFITKILDRQKKLDRQIRRHHYYRIFIWI